MSTERLNAALGGRYRIERELGQGGMATVYLAQDLRHERQVALKVLRPELAAVVGAERFLAEIKTTANLHHPHILPLHDSGEADGFLFYVMPYVEDESLRDRMRREAQLPVDEAVEIAKRVCGALQHAHERGVIHRDIKPANILVQDGEPVVADFGIALAMSAAGGTRLTETGLSVGTPYYMSPEQATGDQEVGPRSDVYSLGCVLHEMLVGDPPYGGSTAQAVLAKIIAGGPVAPTRSRPSIPAHVDAAIRKALERLPADRFADAQVFARALADPAFRYGDEPTPGVTADSLHWKRLAVGGWGVAALGLAFSGWLVATRSGPGPVARFPLVLPEEEGLFYTGPANLPRFDLLPDGSGLVYVSRMDPRAAPNLHSRAFDRLEGRPLPGTRGASTPTVSPDGRRVAFRTFEGGLGIASLAGGPATLVVESGVVAGAAWASDDEVYYLTEPGFELRRVAADGGGSESVVELEPTPAEGGYGFVDLLPGNDAAIVTAFPADRSDLPAYAVHVVDLGTGRSAGSVAGLIGVYAHSGHLLYVTADGVLTGTRLNARSLDLSGGSVALAEGVEVRGPGNTDLSVTPNGTLAYATPSVDTPEGIVWMSPTGSEPVDPTWNSLGEYEGLSLSPSGGRLALVVQEAGREDVWIKELGGGPWSRLVPGGSGTRAPAWTPDGRSVSFVSRDAPSVVEVKPADGSATERTVVDVGRPVAEMRWSRDGAWLVTSVTGPPSYDILAWPTDGSGEPVALVDGPFDEHQPALSPDGRYLAYVSEESGRSEVFVVPFPDVGRERRQISPSGGFEPVWDRTGTRLFYRTSDRLEIMVADLSSSLDGAIPRFHFALPSMNDYENNDRNRLVDLAPDGRFVMIERAGVFGASGHPVIVQNFFRELRERVGG